MKKTYIVIGTLLLCSGLMAQTPANRTSKTVAADVLAQMPANEQQSYNELIGQLSQAGEGAVQTLIGMMNPPGKGDNAKIDYALSGLSHFVMAKGNEEKDGSSFHKRIVAGISVKNRQRGCFSWLFSAESIPVVNDFSILSPIPLRSFFLRFRQWSICSPCGARSQSSPARRDRPLSSLEASGYIR